MASGSNAATPAAASPTPTPSMASAADSSARTVAANETSQTNNQVAEVDEADFVKNDDKYVYAAMNGAFRILNAWPPEQADELARLPLPGTPKKLLVHQDRAVVFASVARTSTQAKPTTAGHAARPECTYGYDCDFGGDGTATALLVFDISDRAQPKQLRRIDLRGSLVAARRTGSVVHTVAVTPEVTFQGLTTSLPGISACDPWLTREQIDLTAQTVRERNAHIIANTALPELAPYVREGDLEYAADSCENMYFDERAKGRAFTSLVALDLADQAEPGIATIVSRAGAVYASEESLYMAVLDSDGLASAGRAALGSESTVHKFHVGGGAHDVAYLASGLVKGRVLSQFSMDEHRDHLRIATTSGKVPDPNVHSTLSVLAQEGGELRVVGQVDNIAKGEDIRAVRFDGDNGFVVTFKKTDPLYMFDLSRPEQPIITGELKIPGFSTYMHMLNDTHLLSIGYDAEDHDSFAFFSGVLLQIFDVSRPNAPTLVHKTVIGTRGTSSEALTNHLAFTLWNDMLALPMTICEGGSGGSFGTTTFSGLIVYDVSLAHGIVERGRVAHPSATGGYQNASCSNWWSRAGSVVQRSIFMDDYVYSIAQDIMRVQNLNALGDDVSSVSLIP